MSMTKGDYYTFVFATLLALLLGVFLIVSYYPHFKSNSKRYDHAIAFVEVVKPINNVAAVVLIKQMTPHKMPTISGNAEITRGSEIYIKAPDSMRHKLRISPENRHVLRCIKISPDDYGWKVREVFTRHQCQDRHYE